jgi:hypothetical protein
MSGEKDEELKASLARLMDLDARSEILRKYLLYDREVDEKAKLRSEFEEFKVASGKELRAKDSMLEDMRRAHQEELDLKERERSEIVSEYEGKLKEASAQAGGLGERLSKAESDLGRVTSERDAKDSEYASKMASMVEEKAREESDREIAEWRATSKPMEVGEAARAKLSDIVAKWAGSVGQGQLEPTDETERFVFAEIEKEVSRRLEARGREKVDSGAPQPSDAAAEGPSQNG